MGSIRLQLNADKMDVMWCASARRSLSLPVAPDIIANVAINQMSIMRNIEVLIEEDLGSASHVRLDISRCFAALR
jgi:hypothetical protein